MVPGGFVVLYRGDLPIRRTTSGSTGVLTVDSEEKTLAYPEKVSALLEEGQSLWLDTLSRSLMDSGELSRLIHSVGIRGITSNPAIFEKAVSGSRDYDEEIRQLAGNGDPPEDILRRLMTEDVRRACDLFLPVFRSTGGGDGFVSIEVSPLLADRTEDSVEEARRLHKMVDRPNLFVKIPGTEAGFPAIRELVSEGISVNVTLLFSPEAYRKVEDDSSGGVGNVPESGLKEGVPQPMATARIPFFCSGDSVR